MKGKLFLLSAGGTGGHLFPAQSLAITLQLRGHCVHLITDHRAMRYADHFPTDRIHVVSSATVNSKVGSKNPLKILKALWHLLKGILQSGRIIRKIKPDAIIGFGGYPTIPPLLAGLKAGCPTLVHEQNAVMGRANKLLAKWVDAIAGGFLPPDKGIYQAKTFITGNPVRPAIIEAAMHDYQPPSVGGDFNFVVFGGSQGTQFFADILPRALSLMTNEKRNRLRLTLQARKEDIEKVRLKCAQLGVKADISPFFDDLAQRMGNAHLVLSRSGASTVSELAVIGCPAIFIPYPYALDHDQAENARTMVEKGGAEVIPQSQLSARKLADMLEDYMHDPQKLTQIAARAKCVGKHNATDLLADLVEAIADGKTVKEFKEQ